MGASAAPLRLAEPIVAVDDLQSEEALLHPLDCAARTLVEAFADEAPTRFISREGHERQYMAALLNFLRSQYHYELVEAGDFRCVALVREVPEGAAAGAAGGGAAAGEEEWEEEQAEQQARGGGLRVDPSRAEASANIEGGAAQQTKPPQAEEASQAGRGAVDPQLLRAALEAGFLDALLALGVPRLEAEMLMHVRPERLGVVEQLRRGLSQKMEAYRQAHGPLLHLHFLATMPGKQGAGLGRTVLKHLERMADAEGRRLYLEASSHESRRLYQRHGFQDVEEFPLWSKGGPVLYLMARPPGASSAPSSEDDLAGSAQAAAEEQVEEPAGQEAGQAAGDGSEQASGGGAYAAKLPPPKGPAGELPDSLHGERAAPNQL